MDVTPFDALRQSTKPVVAAVNGLCQGGGLQIALCSDMAVVSEHAQFRVPELFRGIADTHYSQMLARLIGPVRARDLLFTGRRPGCIPTFGWTAGCEPTVHAVKSVTAGRTAAPRRGASPRR